MGKTLLTPKRLSFLELAQAEPQITKRFYLTGGTALAEFYLEHRFSEDLDFFCEQEEVDPKVVEAFLKKVSSPLSVQRLERSQFLGLFSYHLIYHDGEKLKVDFSYYPFPRIEKGTKYKNLEIASLYDIAVDKLHTLFMKPRARDYIDLYFVMREKDYGLEKIIADAKAKFDWDIDPLTLASQFLRVKEFVETPLMLKPFSRPEMEDFFLQLANELKGRIFK